MTEQAQPPATTGAAEGSDAGRMLALWAAGASLRTIAAALNQDGCRTARGTRWSPQSVSTSIAASPERHDVAVREGFWSASPMRAGQLDAWLAAAPRDVAAAVAPEPGRPAPAAELSTHVAGTRAAAFAGGVAPDEHAHRDHLVLFYRDEAELMGELTPYVSEGLSGQGHSVVIATAGHRGALRAALPPRRLERAEREGRFLALDAAETLALFMRDGLPDPALFEEHVGGVVRAHQSGDSILCAYGEMVALLWKGGNVVGALELEELWNDLQGLTTFSLLCAYPMADAQEPPGDGLAEIGRRHTFVHMTQEIDHEADGAEGTLQVLLDCTRTLLRVESAEQTVGVLIRAVTDLGGSTVPAGLATGDALSLDVSLGESDPLLAVAPRGSAARRNLELMLPGLVEDARMAAHNASRLARLCEQVDTDPLTGLGNRRGLTRVRALLGTDSVAMVDLDYFKAVNDTHGHEGGDRVLVALSRTMRQHLRSSDLVFRLGGEEFLLILPGTTPLGVLVALENLRRHWEEERPLPISFSAGVAGVDEADLSAAVVAADAALYVAKNAGRDRFELSVTAPAPDPAQLAGPG